MREIKKQKFAVRLVETGHVDVMVSIRSNFFYTRTVPCELWHFDKGKPASRRDQVLMIDARNIYRKVTRKVYDFTPEQLQNLTAIVWLYRGQSDRFIALLQDYLVRTIAEAGSVKDKAGEFRKSYDAYSSVISPLLKSLSKDSALLAILKERDDAAKECFASLDKWTARIAKTGTSRVPQNSQSKRNLPKNWTRWLMRAVTLSRMWIWSASYQYAWLIRLGRMLGIRSHESWDNRAIGKLEKELEAVRKDLVEQLKAVVYFQRQAFWLISRFPEAKFVAVAGLCKAVSIADIKAADWSLTPGRLCWCCTTRS